MKGQKQKKLAKMYFIGGIVSLVFMLWSAIGGNISRLSGQTIYPKKEVSIDGCPKEWNVTVSNSAENQAMPMEGLEW